MKVLKICWSDFQGAGGTSLSMRKLNEGLRRAGLKVDVLCGNKTLETSTSFLLKRSITDKVLHRITSHIGLNDVHAVSTFRIPDGRLFREADIVHAHSLHSGFFSYLALPKLSRLKPMVWTLHDVWAVTGHCSTFLDCERWQTGCGRCPYPAVYPPVRRDATHWEWLLKRHAYRHSKITLVVRSRWFEEVLKKSILSHLPRFVIPAGLDAEVFRPLDRELCRRALGIPAGKKVILFVTRSLGDTRKGGDLLSKALARLPESLKRESLLLTMGKSGESALDAQTGMPVKHLGWVESDPFKAIVYSAADVYVSPTQAETFGLTLIESMACATPVVATAVGPVPELVRHGVTGYAVRPGDADDLARGIEEILSDPTKSESLGRQGRQRVEAEYRLECEVERYIELYRNILNT